MASPALSQASTAFETDVPQIQDEKKSQRRAALQHVKQVTTSQDILLFLVAYRILNALSVRTFFQPDEYFQSLEPAWVIAFGENSGAWITWEWKNQLRSAIHPALFAGIYYLSAELSKLLKLTPYHHAELLLAAPKVTQAVIAALGDYYTWRLGEPFLNRETTLTIIALYQWPWHWSLDATGEEETNQYGLREAQKPDQDRELAEFVSENNQNTEKAHSTAYRLCRCLLLAAVACVLRPTNILIWICLTCFSLWKSSSNGRLLNLPWISGSLWVNITSIAHGPATRRERLILVLEAAVCG
ncbi:MAG: hypothetical protein Q9213_007597, partial [Squamulea squamosa]